MSTQHATGPEAGPTVTVWWAHRGLAGALDPAHLSADERGRVSRLRREPDRERSAVARGVLRLALAGHLGAAPADVAIEWSHGPALPGSLATWASVSHSDDAVGVAVSTAGPVGVDVEALRRTRNLSPSVQQAVFTGDERAELTALASVDRLPAALRLWTLKEAVLKATGDGLVRPPATLSLSGFAGQPTLERFEAREDLVGAAQLRGLTPVVPPAGQPDAAGQPGYVASLAVLSATPFRLVERDAAELIG